MKSLFATLVMMGALSLGAAETNPIADPAAQVFAFDGRLRITVLTDRLLRIEYSASERPEFEDRASFTFVNRRLPVVPFAVERLDGGGVIVDTGKVRFKCADPASAMTAEIAGGFHFDLLADPAAAGNLGGTTRTLDSAHNFTSLDSRLGAGLVSRGGGAVVDDSGSLVFRATTAPWREWWTHRADPHSRDLYLFAYGHDYRAALADYIRVAGRVPLPPRWVFGYWWCRYWQYSDAELISLADEFRRQSLPLDVMVVDMDWHETWGIGEGGGLDEFNQLHGWTGYTWKRSLFPDPGRFLAALHDRNLKTSLNLHPASGIQPREECYARFAAAYDWPEQGRAVPYRGEEERWAGVWFDEVIAPLEREGVDFWWVDWQQWRAAKSDAALDNAYWLAYLFHRHARQRGQTRPVFYSRWGGLGAHRHQLAFSGDLVIDWDAFRAVPYFTATAANVACGYWGHDITGSLADEPGGPNAELYVRWLQQGVFEPIFKTHSGKHPDRDQKPWLYRRQFPLLAAAIRQRYEFAPYLYTAARATYDTGLAICRPLYYAESETDAAYDRALPEYLVGEDLVSLAVTEPVEPVTALAGTVVYLPAGCWYDLAAGELLAGARYHRRAYTLAENPVFSRAGAIIPLYLESVRNLQQKSGDEFALLCVPGAATGQGELYEDAGDGLDYVHACARTRFTQIDDGTNIVVTVAARTGEYPGALAARRISLRLPGRLAPTRVTLDGQEIAWIYDAALPGVIVPGQVLTAAAAHEFRLEFTCAARAAEAKLDGFRGLSGRLGALAEEFKVEYAQKVNTYAMLPDAFLELTAAASRLQVAPERGAEILDGFAAARAALAEHLPVWERSCGRSFVRRIAAQLAGAGELPPELQVAPATIARLDGRRADCGGSTLAVMVVSWQVAATDLRWRQTAYELEIRQAGKTLFASGTVGEEKSTGVSTPRLELSPGAEAVVRLRVRDQRWQWTPWRETVLAAANALPLGRLHLRHCSDAKLREQISELPDESAALTALGRYALDGDLPALKVGAAERERQAKAACERALATGDADELARAYLLAAEMIADANCRADLVGEDHWYFERLQPLERALTAAGLAVPEREASAAVTADAVRAGRYAGGARERALLARWARRRLAGIEEGDACSYPAFKRFTLRLGREMPVREFAASYDSPYGAIVSDWSFGEGGRWRWRFTIPANTTATVIAPDGQARYYGAGEYVLEGHD